MAILKINPINGELYATNPGNTTTTSDLALTSTKTADYTAVSGQRVVCDTSANSFTITTPNNGYFGVLDKIGNSPTTGFGLNSLTVIAAENTTIMGDSSLILNVGAISVEFKLVGTDWRIINGNSGSSKLLSLPQNKSLYYYDSSTGFLEPIGIGTENQSLIAKPNSSPPYQWAAPTGGREVLTANRTYYVRTDGSDGNDGLSDTADGAFASIHAFFNAIDKLDKNGFSVTGQVATGTYTLTSQCDVKEGIGNGLVSLIGNNATITASTSLFYLVKKETGRFHIEGFSFTNTGNSLGTRFLTTFAGLTTFKLLNFGATTTEALSSQFHLYSTTGGVLIPVGNYTVSGKALISLFSGGLFLDDAIINSTPTTVTVTYSGTPELFYNFYCASTGRMVFASTKLIFSGAVTGTRYYVATGGAINTYGGGANYIPGSIAGVLASGGFYA